jgi:hypothetical protein
MSEKRGGASQPDGGGKEERQRLDGARKHESYYSLDTDDMLRVERRKTTRPQAYWGESDELEPRFADHVQLSRVESHYHLTFGQSQVPINTDSGTAPVNEIRPIARMIIPQEVIRRLVTLIKQSTRGEEKKDERADDR